MKNLIIVIHIFSTLLLVGCADKGVYVGEKKDGKRHCQGTLTFSDGISYEGEYRNDKRHGQGTLTKPNGDKYVGDFTWRVSDCVELVGVTHGIGGAAART